MSSRPLLGSPMPRKEDYRFLTGSSCFTDDLQPPDCLYARILRADVPHAKNLQINTSAAANHDGVAGVYTATALRAAGVSAIPSLSQTEPFAVRDRFGAAFPDPSQYPLAEDRIRYLGEPLALVIATSVEAACDAVELIEVNYEAEAAVISYVDAQDPQSTKIWPELDSNVSFEWDHGDLAATEAAFASAAHVVHASLENNRVVIAFMEPRSAIAEFDDNRLTLTTGSQGAPGLQASLCAILGLETKQLRVITPDTGGGFGARGGAYPEYALALFAASQHRMAVKWTAERSESFLSDCQARDHHFDASLALDADGRFLGLKVHADWRHGAYIASRSFSVMTQYLPPTLGGVYNVPSLHLRLRGLFSNTTTQSAYRGVGRVEATYIIESLIDVAARKLGESALALRQRNLIKPTQLPRRAAGGALYRSGDFPANLTRAADLADWQGFSARADAARDRGQLRGIGIGMFIENDGGAPIEFAGIRALPDGAVQLLAGTQDFGMGHQTVYSQIVADQLGVAFADVDVIEGDTDVVPRGSGSHGSRSGRVGGGAIVTAAHAWIEVGKRLTARLFQTTPEHIEYVVEQACFQIVGTERSANISEVAQFADEVGESFRGDAEFQVTEPAHSNGCQIVELEVDPETGVLTIVTHLIVMDAGVLLNPLIVEGQMHGGLAQGLGQAWLEHVAFDPTTGQTLSGSFMDYAMPRADDMPNFATVFNEIRENDNPLGVKGAGEGPTSGAPAAFMNALRVALHAGGGTDVAMPATPERVWRALQAE